MDDMNASIQHGEEAVNELFHHGVKGMKWGVVRNKIKANRVASYKETAARSARIVSGTASRRDKANQILGKGMDGRGGLIALRKKTAAKQAVRAETKAGRIERGDRGVIKRTATKADTALSAGAKVIDKGQKDLVFLPLKNRQEAASRTQSQVLGAAARINRDPKFRGKDLKTNPRLKQAYFDRVANEAKTIYAKELGISRVEAWGDFLGVSTNNTTTGMRFSAPSSRIRHAEDSEETLLELNFVLDKLGQIADVSVPEKFLSHSGDDLELFHYGVKGMKWGVRTVDQASKPTLVRQKKALLNEKGVTVTQRRAGKFVQTTGGQRNKASDDAVKAHAGRQKAKKSTTDALSNAELKAVNERMRLEQEFAKLDKKTTRRGASFVKQLFGNQNVRAGAAKVAGKALGV